MNSPATQGHGKSSKATRSYGAATNAKQGNGKATPSSGNELRSNEQKSKKERTA
jgi:hypothetical protein